MFSSTVIQMFTSSFVFLLFLGLTLIITALVFFQLEEDEVGNAKFILPEKTFSKWLLPQFTRYLLYNEIFAENNTCDSHLWYHFKILKYFVYAVLPFLPETCRPCAILSLPKRHEEPVAPSAGRWRSSSPQKVQMTPWRAPKWCGWFCKQLSC